MATLITPNVIAKEALMQLENNLVMGNLVHRDYKKEFVKVGSTVSIRKPVKFVASDGSTRVNQDVSESTTSIVIDKRKHVSWTFSAEELTLTIEKYSERYITPAMISLADAVDYDLCTLYKDLFQGVGTAADTPDTFATSVQLVGQKMDEQAVPVDSRYLVLNPASYWAIAGSQTALNQSAAMVEGAYRKAKLGMIGNFDVYGVQNIRSHTHGTLDAAATVSGGSQIGSSVLLAAAGNLGTVVAGDLLTFPGCYDVNPINKATLSNLKMFRVTAAGTATAGGVLTVSIYPSIITSGAYKTCSASPTASGTVVHIADHVGNMGFKKQCFALVMIPIELPDSASFKARETHNNISIAVVKSFDIDEYEEIIRLDIMYGVKTIYPEMGVRLFG